MDIIVGNKIKRDMCVISVIVVTYNQEKTIARTLDSILMQKCRVPFEVVVGDDCSSDDTRKICEEYAKRFPDTIRLMPKEENKGVADNYFDCLLACRGKYIADCAGDDFWTDDRKLDKQVTILEGDASVTLVHTNWSYYDGQTGKQTPNGVKMFRERITDGREMVEAIVTQTTDVVIHLCTSMYRADVFRKAYSEDTALFRNKSFTCEDIQIAFVMARNGNIAYIPDNTLNYSYGCSESVSYSENSAKQYRFFKGVTDLSFYICNKYNIHGKRTEWYFRHRLFSLAMHAFRGKSKPLRDDVHMCARRWHVRWQIKTILLFAVMSNDVTWSAALYARKVLLRIMKGKEA